MMIVKNFSQTSFLLSGMMYSDFLYRPPPPSYQASMQEYRLRLLLLDRGGAGQHGATATAATNNATTAESPSDGIAPPPLYRQQLR